MATGKKQIQQLAKQFFRLSVVDGELSAERVGGILAYVEKHRPARPVAVLRAYERLVAAEVARSHAVIEHAGPINAGVLASIGASMTQKYRRKITPTAQRNDALLAGLRIRVGDDLYESSVASQLAALSAAV